MYKLFLTFRYLTRKKIVIFPILVVWLCVMMLIIVTSIMTGFVDRVKNANRDLFGDIIISTMSPQGFDGYDELSGKLKKQFPEVVATTPVVEAYSLLYVPGVQKSVPSLLVGVRPEERSQVSQFRQSLFQQYQGPEETVAILAQRLPATKQDLIAYADKYESEKWKAYTRAEDERALVQGGKMSWGRTTTEWTRAGIAAGVAMLVTAGLTALLIGRARQRRSGFTYIGAGLVGVVGMGVAVVVLTWPMIVPQSISVADDAVKQRATEMDQGLRALDAARGLPEREYKTQADLMAALMPAKVSFDLPKAAKELPPGVAPLPEQGCFVGSQLGFFRRDMRGNFVHRYPDTYPRVAVTVFPPDKEGRISVKGTNAFTQEMTVVDDVHTGVYDVDSLDVFAPFDLVQLMMGMRADPAVVAKDPTADFPARTHQLLIKLSPAGEARLKEIRYAMDKWVEREHPGLEVQTWDEKQARYLGAVENEATMMTFIMLLMSVVVLVVIFLIFYQIVRDKTKDIGIIKAVGGSEPGVASIFLWYGLLIGAVGGGLGVVTGTLFMTHTNEIHEWIFQTFGIVIWDRSVYLFDRIPDVVHVQDVVLYFGIALVSGVLGALIPATKAALEDPVQAVRYE
jgi:ABC-type lipoprotein release transport system permease subunit